MKRSQLRRYTPLRAKPQRRARPDEPLADWCKVAIPGLCTGRATDRHHIAGRVGPHADDPENTVDCCNACHIHGIHGNSEWAYDNGWMRRRIA